MAHRDLNPLAGKHQPGCLTGHESHYIVGNTCSYRWHAARRAQADSWIDYMNADALATNEWYENVENLAKLDELVEVAANRLGRDRQLVGKLRHAQRRVRLQGGEDPVLPDLLAGSDDFHA